LIGRELKHSFSPQYFKTKFENEQIQNALYKLFPLKDINDFCTLIKEKNFKGLNVTIPYKESIIPFLDDLSKDAKKIGAVNTIQFVNNKKIGHNTDVLGFEKSIKPLLLKQHKTALIFGTGGASKSVAFVFNRLGISYKFVSRKRNFLQYEDVTKELLQKYSILVNTTPIGMFPNLEECLNIDYSGLNQNHLVYDLIYNPIETLFLKKAKEQNSVIKNGLEMLEIQAEESWKIWQE